ncbi:EF-Tu/IF-2/RF-3 family GTPase [Streptomyces syringium]|uniref:EF-Tu C-terminal domain-related protein n=1 Tax=Streptomyces syringium TaxID=76729 RepID=UPI0037D78A7E
MDMNSEPFLMPVEDVFSRPVRGMFVTGLIERGTIRPGDAVEIAGFGWTEACEVTAVEGWPGEMLDAGEAGQNVAVWLRGLRPEDVRQGQVVAVPGTVTQHAEFEAEAHLFSEEEGGHADPLAAESKRGAQFHFRTTDVTGRVPTLVYEDARALMHVRLAEPVPMAEGLRFAIRERGRAVGSGVVTRVLD